MEELMLLNLVLEKIPESALDSREIKPVNPKGNQSWIFIGRTDAEAEVLILWPPDVKNWLIRKDPDTGKDKAGREGEDRGWDGWMASPTRWTWVWASSGSWWCIGKPGMLQSMGLWRVGHDWATELNWHAEVTIACPKTITREQVGERKIVTRKDKWMTHWTLALFLMEILTQQMKSYQETWTASLTLRPSSISNWFLMPMVIIYELLPVFIHTYN